MKFLKKVWSFLIKVVVTSIHVCRLYKLWHIVFSFIYHRKHNSLELSSGLSGFETWEKMRKVKWVADGPKELWDAINSPHKFEYCVQELEKGNTQPSGSCDCDDFAMWGSHVMDEKYKPHYFCLGWSKDTSFKFEGHAVCIYQENDGLWHIGNWGNRGPFNSLRSLCEAMLIEAGEGNIPLVWCVYTKKLKLVNYGWGFPKKEVGHGF